MTALILSDYLEDKLIDHILRNTAFPTPGTNIWIGLYTADPSDSGGGTPVSGGSYARVQVTAWDAPSGGATANTNAITFPTATANWGLVCAIGIFDASTAGNLLMWGELTVDKQVDLGDTFSIAAGDLDISLGGDYSTSLANSLLSHILRNTAYSKPTNVKAHLYTTLPNAADSGGVEVSGGSYAAQAIFDTTGWDAPAGTGATENTSTVTFPVATGNWGTVVGVCLRDQAAGLLFFKTLTASKIVNNGDTFRFSAGALDVAIQ